MATAAKAPVAGMTGAVRSLQWTIQDMNGSVEHLGQSHDHMRRAQNIMAWTTAIFGALLLSGLVWIANDIFHLKDQLMESERRFDGVDAQMGALGARIDDLNIAIEQLSAQILAARSQTAPLPSGPDVSVLSSPTSAESLQAAQVPAETAALDAAAQPQQPPVQQQQQVAPQEQPVQPPAAQPQQQAALAPAPAAEENPIPQIAGFVPPSPPAPRDQLTPEELAAPAPVVSAAAPAAEPAAEPSNGAAAVPASAPASSAGADLTDDQLLSFNDDQIDPADELLLLDENGNPQ